MRNLLLAVGVTILLAPLFLVTSVEGQEVKRIDSKGLNDLLTNNKGKVVVLDFWASF